MKNIAVMTTSQTEWVVLEGMLACSVGSGSARVFSTPMLCALMENAAMGCLCEYLEEGETTVGTYIAIEHMSATPVGMKVIAQATVTEVNGREISFEVTAYDECGQIGKASHKRFVVFSEKFQAKTDSKLESKG